MRDAGIEVEEDLLEKYNLQNIDVLKIGNHGSRTSKIKGLLKKKKSRYQNQILNVKNKVIFINFSKL